MIKRNTRRGLVLLSLAAAALVPALAAPAAPAKIQLPGLLSLRPSHGSLTDNPIADYTTTKACPADHRALGVVVLRGPDGSPNFLGGNFTPTAAKPTGTLDGNSLQSVVIAAGLKTGFYEIDVQCYNDDFSDAVTADVNAVKINIEAGTWCAPVGLPARHLAKVHR